MFLNMSYLKVICYCTKLTADLSMVITFITIAPKVISNYFIRNFCRLRAYEVESFEQSSQSLRPSKQTLMYIYR